MMVLMRKRKKGMEGSGEEAVVKSGAEEKDKGEEESDLVEVMVGAKGQ